MTRGFLGRGTGNAIVAAATLAAVSLIGLASEPITAENAGSLVEASRIDVGLHVFELAFLSDAQLAVADSERTAFWDLESGTSYVEFTRYEIGRVIGISPGRSNLAVYTASRNAEIWTVDPLEKQFTLCSIEDTEWPRAAFSPNGRHLAITNRWNDIEVWNLETRGRRHVLTGHHSNLFALAFSPDGRCLATGGGTSSRDDAGESTIGVWDVSSGDRLAWLPTEDLGDNHDLTFTVEGSRLISGGQRRMLAWDASTWERDYDSGPSYPGSYGLTLSPNGMLLAVATDNRRLRVVDAASLRAVRDVYVGAELVDVAFSPDGTRLAASCTDGTVRVYHVP